MKRVCPYLLFLLPFLANAQTVDLPDSASLRTYVDKYFNGYSTATPGATISVVHNGEVVFSNAYGSANLEYDIPNTTSTKFHVASVAKQFTAFFILLLQERGKLRRDDDIRQYLPEVPKFGYKITLRHLASHSSGLRDQWNSLIVAGVRPDDVIDMTMCLHLSANRKN
jgi:Beta-lactamase class C and other penicillin binding proteins